MCFAFKDIIKSTQERVNECSAEWEIAFPISHLDTDAVCFLNNCVLVRAGRSKGQYKIALSVSLTATYWETLEKKKKPTIKDDLNRLLLNLRLSKSGLEKERQKEREREGERERMGEYRAPLLHVFPPSLNSFQLTFQWLGFGSLAMCGFFCLCGRTSFIFHTQFSFIPFFPFSPFSPLYPVSLSLLFSSSFLLWSLFFVYRSFSFLLVFFALKWDIERSHEPSQRKREGSQQWMAPFREKEQQGHKQS